MAPEEGDVVKGVGEFIACPRCGGDGWIDPPESHGTNAERVICPKCKGRPVLLDDGSV